MTKKKIKKLKIRLVDPKVPDSYICEAFDSSLEQDEIITDEEDKIFDDSFNNCPVRDNSKPKDFFDVLMSNESRRSFTVNTAAQNEEIPEETKLLREIESEDLLNKRKATRSKNKTKLVEMVKRHRMLSGDPSSSSDDESLFTIQSNIRRYTTDVRSQKCSDVKVKSKENSKQNALCDDDEDDPSDMFSAIAKKKNTSILKYFSKTETRKTVIKGRVRVRKLTEIDMFEGVKSVNSRNMSLLNGNLKNNAKPMVNGKEVKLAPLFQKRVKNMVDPEVQKARLDFLQNGLPTNLKKFCEKKNSDEKLYTSFFPAISHVQQKDDNPLWIIKPVTVPLLRTTDDFHFSIGRKVFRFEIRNDIPESGSEEIIVDKNLEHLKSKYNKPEMNFIFTKLKEKKDAFLKKVEEADKNQGGIDNSSEIIDAIDDCEGDCSLWTDIYKPGSTEIMENNKTVTLVMEWLKSWKEYNNEIKSSSKTGGRMECSNNKDILTDDSDGAFVSDQESSRLRTPVNICILSGPVSSGKTALVRALASELDYNILEVNASSRRTGKKLLLDLQEATKSHQVSVGLAVPTVRRSDEHHKSKKTKKKKRKQEPAKTVPNSGKISLILIEDADIFFEEHDEGFVSAISTLVQSSKRPFIFLCNDSSYGYLERLKLQQTLVLEMRRPNFQNSCMVLEVIAGLEGVFPKQEDIEDLIRGNELDLRKSILELQFWIQSGQNLIKDKGRPLDLGRLWWGLNKFLFNKDRVHHLKLNYRKRKRVNELYDSSSADECKAPKKVKLNAGDVKIPKNSPSERKSDSRIHAYANILETVSLCDLFKLDGGLEPVPRNESKPKDSLSLSECAESVDWNRKNLSALITAELIRTSASVFMSSAQDKQTRSCDLGNPSWDEIRWRRIQNDARRDLTSLIPFYSAQNKRTVCSDYLPVLRNMCRTEKMRCQTNVKRKNRYLHYFKTLGAVVREETLDISCDVLDV